MNIYIAAAIVALALIIFSCESKGGGSSGGKTRERKIINNFS
jgi:hypothetical protein